MYVNPNLIIKIKIQKCPQSSNDAVIEKFSQTAVKEDCEISNHLKVNVSTDEDYLYFLPNNFDIILLVDCQETTNGFVAICLRDKTSEEFLKP